MSTVIDGLTNGTAYWFSVTARNAIGESEASDSAVGTPGPRAGVPTDVRVEIGDGTATVRWAAPSTAGGSALTGFTLTVSARGETITTVHPFPQSTSRGFEGLTNGVEHTFVLTATNETGTSDPVVVKATPSAKPGAPTGVKAVAGDGEATVSWQAAPDRDTPITSYTVTTHPGGAITTVSGTETTATVTGLTNGTATGSV